MFVFVCVRVCVCVRVLWTIADERKKSKMNEVSTIEVRVLLPSWLTVLAVISLSKCLDKRDRQIEVDDISSPSLVNNWLSWQNSRLR